MDSIAILLEEYQTLRQEVMAAMGSRNSILSFGLAIIGAIFTASIATQTSTTTSLLASLILVLIVPLISVSILFMWLGEYHRMQRAGKFLADLEEKVNEAASKELLTWESHLRDERHHMTYPYNTTVLLLALISLASLIIGLFTMQLSTGWTWALSILGVGLHGWVYFYVVSLMLKWQNA